MLAIDVNAHKIKRAGEAIPPSLRSKLNFVVADIAEVELIHRPDVAILAHSL